MSRPFRSDMVPIVSRIDDLEVIEEASADPGNLEVQIQEIRASEGELARSR